MSEKTTDEEMLFEHDPKGAFAQFVAPMAGYGVTMASFFRPTVTEQYPREPARVMPRFHGRHQLNRYDDGLEKCVGCELCAWACPADAIFVEAASNTPDEQYSAGERYGRGPPRRVKAREQDGVQRESARKNRGLPFETGAGHALYEPARLCAFSFLSELR